MRIVVAAVLLTVMLAPAAFPAEDTGDGPVKMMWNSAMTKFRNAAKNGVLQVIKERRSVRAYKPEQIKESELLAVIEAGLYAPSAKNSQPWHFTVIQNAGFLEELTLAYRDEIKSRGGDTAKIADEDKEFKSFNGAPCAIIISGEAADDMAGVSCAAAVQNMLIAAASLNLGACWLQTHMILFEGLKGEKLAQTIRIPEGYRPLYAISLGYPAEQPEPKPRRTGTVTYVK
jgi:nitroreductase